MNIIALYPIIVNGIIMFWVFKRIKKYLSDNMTEFEVYKLLVETVIFSIPLGLLVSILFWQKIKKGRI